MSGCFQQRPTNRVLNCWTALIDFCRVASLVVSQRRILNNLYNVDKDPTNIRTFPTTTNNSSTILFYYRNRSESLNLAVKKNIQKNSEPFQPFPKSRQQIC